MGRAFITTTGQTVAAGATPIAATPSGTDSFQVRNSVPGTPIRLIYMTALNQVAGIARIFSPLMHDNQEGLRYRSLIADNENFLANGSVEPLFPQDLLNVQLSGSAVAGDREGIAFGTFHEDLPGAAALLYTWEQIAPLVKHLSTLEISMTMGTGGGYSGATAFNAAANLGVLHANTYYAILGYRVNGRMVTIAFSGPDTANFRCGGPANPTDYFLTTDWYKNLSRMTGFPLIPVINSANAGGTFVDGVNDENALTNIININLAELTGLPG